MACTATPDQVDSAWLWAATVCILSSFLSCVSGDRERGQSSLMSPLQEHEFRQVFCSPAS